MRAARLGLLLGISLASMSEVWSCNSLIFSNNATYNTTGYQREIVTMMIMTMQGKYHVATEILLLVLIRVVLLLEILVVSIMMGVIVEALVMVIGVGTTVTVPIRLRSSRSSSSSSSPQSVLVEILQTIRGPFWPASLTVALKPLMAVCPDKARKEGLGELTSSLPGRQLTNAASPETRFNIGHLRKHKTRWW